MAALGPDAHCASSPHRIEEMTDLSLRDGSPFSLDNSGQLRDGGGWIFHLVHSVFQSAPEIFDGAEIWAFGWPVHHIDVILLQELCADPSCVGSGIIMLEGGDLEVLQHEWQNMLL